MQIDEQLISYLEDLSCLTLLDTEKIRLTEDLQKILNGITRLNELNTDGVPECSHPWDNGASLDIVNVFREDEVRPSLDRKLVLENAPVKNDEMFIAPKTVE
jgi:aspartyl-tRNA(Asn)/glutamyl-tRNA(Gln) amidotransferase subunit C